MKVKTLKDNVGALNEEGAILDVSDKQAKRWVSLGAVEEVKAPKKNTSKKETKEGEK